MRVLIVDDDPDFLQLIEFDLKKKGYDTVRANDGEEGLAKATAEKPDLIILDLMMPKMDGLEVCREIRKENQVPIIMLTARGEESDVVAGLEVGADDYLTKPFSLRVLAARVKANLRRTTTAPSTTPSPQETTIMRGDLTIDPSKREVYKKKVKIPLTNTEFNLLWLLASQPGIVFSRDKLLDELRNRELELFDRSIDAHISNVRKKIEDSPKSPRYIVTVWGTGYKFQDS